MVFSHSIVSASFGVSVRLILPCDPEIHKSRKHVVAAIPPRGVRWLTDPSGRIRGGEAATGASRSKRVGRAESQREDEARARMPAIRRRSSATVESDRCERRERQIVQPRLNLVEFSP